MRRPVPTLLRAFTACLLPAVAIAGACTSSRSTPVSGPIDLPEGAWVLQVIRNPAAFDAYVDRTGREGWVALHANDPAAAIEGFADDDDGTRARARAEWTLALLYGDLARTSTAVHGALFELRSARAPLPADSPGHTVAQLAERCGAGEEGLDVPEDDPTVGDARAAFAARAALHRAALAPGASPQALEALRRAASEPVVIEEAEGFQRAWYDPCALDTLGRAWQQRTVRTLGASNWQQAARTWVEAGDLGASLFAPWLTVDDLASELDDARSPGVVGATMPSLQHIGMTPQPPSTDDRQLARDEVRHLDAALDRLRTDLSDGATDDQLAMISDLGMIDRFRQEILVVRARAALEVGHLARAQVYLDLGRDVTERGAGVGNKPSLLALQTEVRVRSFRTREALDALHVLSERHPELTGLEEQAGNWSVLQGLDRSGDSKEN